MRTRTALLICLLWTGSVHAQQATCTFTWNSLTKSIIKTCTGAMPMPDLSMEEQIALKRGAVKSCVITAAGAGKTADYRRECK